MTQFTEELELLRQKIAMPTETTFFRRDYDIANETRIKQEIQKCLEYYESNGDAVTLFKNISHILETDVKYLADLNQESDAYLPLLLTLREKLVVSLIRKLNLNMRDQQDASLIIRELVAIYNYLQNHFKNPDWFDNPQAYETTQLSNFRILAEIDEQSWGAEVRNRANILRDGAGAPPQDERIS
ncbi:hypothetical protein BH10PSE19_BH10PSE19_10070 [soil metagenome]